MAQPKRSKHPRKQRTSVEANVLVSWSGTTSRAVAKALADWLPTVIDAAKPWMSDDGLRSGVNWFPEILRQLSSIQIGIVCLAPGNLESPWVHFEAGAIAAKLLDGSRLIPYYVGLGPSDITGPLAHFQGRKTDPTPTWELVRDVNAAIGSTVSDENLKKRFDKFWPELKQAIEKAPAGLMVNARKRTVEDMVREILEILRAQSTAVGAAPIKGLLESVYGSVAPRGATRAAGMTLGELLTLMSGPEGDAFRAFLESLTRKKV